MKNDNSSNEEANLRLFEDIREDVVRAGRHLRIAVDQYEEGRVDADVVLKELSSVKNAVTKVREVEILVAKCTDQIRAGGQGATQLDLADARREIFDRLAKIAEARRG